MSEGADIKVQLSQAGYEAYYFQDLEMVRDRLRLTAPHIVIFDTLSIAEELNNFVNEVIEINSEIIFIPMTDSANFETFSQYKEYGFGEILIYQNESFPIKAVWAVDQVCERLYLTYQNEQLFLDLKKAQLLSETLEQRKSELERSQKASSHIENFSMRIAEYQSALSKEDIVQKFLSNIAEGTVVFFQYLTSLRSFVALQASQMEREQLNGIGAQLTPHELSLLPSQMAVGTMPSGLVQTCQEKLSLISPMGLPLYFKDSLEGVFMYSSKIPQIQIQKLYDEFAIFKLCYSLFMLEKKLDSLEVTDSVTELYNRTFYFRKIEEEFARAQRIKEPLAVLKISIDDFFEIEQTYGEIIRDQILKSLASVLDKSGRPHDVACRTQVNEISIIMPHCSKKGAAIRAERIRRMIEGNQWNDGTLKISVSIGVSEYPSLCEDAASLEATTSKALQFVFEKGGNKICLFKVGSNFRPEFMVNLDG